MKRMNITEARKTLSAIAKNKPQIMSLNDLSFATGYYPEVLGEYLSYFDPTVMIDASFNVKSLEKPLKEYVLDLETKNATKPKRFVVRKKTLREYSSIGDFLLKKMTGEGGLVDVTTVLSDEDLMVLRKMVENEIEERKKAKRRARKKEPKKA